VTYIAAETGSAEKIDFTKLTRTEGLNAIDPKLVARLSS
jgi:hypothetical protein